MSAQPALRENGIKLRQRQRPHRIGLVDHHADRIDKAEVPPGAAHHRDRLRGHAMRALERRHIGCRHIARHQGEIAAAVEKLAQRRAQRPLGCQVRRRRIDAHAGMSLLELGDPALRQLRQDRRYAAFQRSPQWLRGTRLVSRKRVVQPWLQ